MVPAHGRTLSHPDTGETSKLISAKPQASSLVACGRPEAIADLYLYLASQERFSASAQRKRLSRQLRDVLMKEWTLVGIPLVITALAALAAVEKEEDVESAGTMLASSFLCAHAFSPNVDHRAL